MAKKKKGGKKKKTSKGRKLKMVGGKLRIKISKKRSVSVAPSALVRYIPLSKLRGAAKKVVSSTQTWKPKQSKKKKRKSPKKKTKALY